MARLHYVILVVATCMTWTLAAKLPSTFERCKVAPALDGKPNECLRRAVDAAVDELSVDGNKELGAIDFDPLQINEVVIDHGGDRPVAIKLVFTKSKLVGLKNMKIESVSGKLSGPKDFKMVIGYSTPNIQLVGGYKINGRVLILPIQGDGKSNLTLINARGKFELHGVPNSKNGKEYLELTKNSLSVDTDRIIFDFKNLFNGDKALGDNMNKFLNENWDEIYKELRGSIEEAFGEVFYAYSKRILERVQFKNIFLLE